MRARVAAAFTASAAAAWPVPLRQSVILPTRCFSVGAAASAPLTARRYCSSGSSDDLAFTPSEVRALVLALLPPTARGARPVPVKEVFYQLPAQLQRQLQLRRNGGLLAFCQTHFPEEIAVSEEVGASGPSLSRRIPPAAGGAEGREGREGVRPPPPSPLHHEQHPRRQSHSFVDTSPPPPPPPAGTSASASSSTAWAYGRGGGGSGGAAAPRVFQPGGNHTTLEVLDALVEYLPTFFVTADAVAMTIPSDIQRLYADTSFAFFMKRFRHYVDIRTTHGHAELRLRPDFDHPKRGLADEHHGGGGAVGFRAGRGGGFGGGGAAAHGASGDAAATPSAAAPSASSSPAGVGGRGVGVGGVGMRSALSRPPRNSEANLVQYIVPRIPKAYTPLAAVLQDISDIVARHPSFDPRLGVTGFLEKYPEYFQINEGRLRARPYKSAPNSLDDLDLASSPLPGVFAKVLALTDAAAAGKNYLDEADRAAATVPTGKLYAQLTAEEKQQVKQQCRSFPRFLRLHGHAIVVSADNMRVIQFRPEYEPCTDTILDHRLAMNAIAPDDPILKIPAEMADTTEADWAVRELYDALPLTQCAELADVVSLVPPAVRDALPAALEDIVLQVLDRYPDYFLSWRYPDDERVIVVQRAGVELPALGPADIVRMATPLIPQGGMDLAALRRRVPLTLQRYFYRHGTKATLNGLPQHFKVAGERVIRLG